MPNDPKKNKEILGISRSLLPEDYKEVYAKIHGSLDAKDPLKRGSLFSALVRVSSNPRYNDRDGFLEDLKHQFLENGDEDSIRNFYTVRKNMLPKIAENIEQAEVLKEHGFTDLELKKIKYLINDNDRAQYYFRFYEDAAEDIEVIDRKLTYKGKKITLRTQEDLEKYKFYDRYYLSTTLARQERLVVENS